MKKSYLALVIITLASFAGYALFKSNKLPESVSNALKPTSQVTVTLATPTDDYLEVKATSTRKILWEALGFEPGFAFKIFSEVASGTETFSANIITQENEVFSGFVTKSENKYSGELVDINTKKKSQITISFENKACVKPSGENANNTTTIKIGQRSMTGCADKFNQ